MTHRASIYRMLRFNKVVFQARNKVAKVGGLVKENKEGVAAVGVAGVAGGSVFGVGNIGIAAMGGAVGVSGGVAAIGVALVAGLAVLGGTKVYKDSRNKRKVAKYHTLKKSMFEKCGGICKECGKNKYYEDFEIDHIRPLSKGGSNDRDNLQLLCGHCNRRKSNKE